MMMIATHATQVIDGLKKLVLDARELEDDETRMDLDEIREEVWDLCKRLRDLRDADIEDTI